jgi:hypothetical protein
MRLLVVIPAGLFVATLGFVAWSVLGTVPYEPAFGEPPHPTVLAGPNLELGTGRLEGIVRDVDNVPSASASVFVQQRGRPIWTFTDDNGYFELNELTGPEPIEVSVLVRGHFPQTFPVAFDRSPLDLRMARRAPDPPTLTQAPSSDLAGAATFGDNARSEGYEVWLLPTRPPSLEEPAVPRRCLVATDGSFVMLDLIHGRYEIRLLPPWAIDGSWPDLLTPWGAPARVFDHPEDGRADLTSAAGGITGVLTKPNGEPIKGALVRVEPILEETQGFPFPSTLSDAAGRWTLRDLPAGLYRVKLTAGSLTVTHGAVRVTPGVLVTPDAD